MVPTKQTWKVSLLRRCSSADVPCWSPLRAKGATLYEPTGVYHQPAFKIDAIDTTGAGDAFLGTLACALARHEDRKSGLRAAAAAGAIATTRLGVVDALPGAETIARFVARTPLRAAQ